MISKLLVIVGAFVACSIATSSKSLPTPQPWPHEWISEIIMMMPGMPHPTTGKVWYDWNVRSIRADYYQYCLIPGSNYFNCSIILNGKPYLINRDANTCCLMTAGRFPDPFYPPNPKWTLTCKYTGEDLVHGVPGTHAHRWICPLNNTLYTTIDPPYAPLNFSNSILSEWDAYYNWNPTKVDVSVFAVPADCNAQCSYEGDGSAPHHSPHERVLDVVKDIHSATNFQDDDDSKSKKEL